MRMIAEAVQAIDAIESMGEKIGQLEALVAWPELTTEERYISMVAVLALTSHGPTAAVLAGLAKVPEAAVVALCKRRDGPLDLVGNAEPRVICPTELLAYGPRS